LSFEKTWFVAADAEGFRGARLPVQRHLTERQPICHSLFRVAL